MSRSEQVPESKVEPKTGDPELDSLIKKYLKLERIKQHRDYIESLAQQNDVNELNKLINKRLTFGTAGIRGAMGPGFGQMNDLVIIQTSQGLADYLTTSKKDTCRDQGVIIGHDARHNSDRFARLAALAFLAKGIPVYYCDHIVPTPFVAYGVRQFGCCAGVVVTASHNPKQDNGYKVYWSNGAQILSPHDKLIQEHIMLEANQTPWPRAWNHEILLTSATVHSPVTTATPPTQTTSESSTVPADWSNILFRIHGDLCKSYFSYVETKLVGGDARYQFNRSSGTCITYTAMHGVGHMYLSRALQLAGFEDIFPVESQKKPDPNFSTVRFPNPEEAGALDLAFETAKHANSTLILANDPDSDRCGAAIYDPMDDRKRVLNGNEIGTLLGWWIWHHCQNRSSSSLASYAGTTDESSSSKSSSKTGSKSHDNNKDDDDDEDPSSPSGSPPVEAANCYMITTAVSSKFLQSMARVEGFNFVETLTGFKYMGNTAEEIINSGTKENPKKVLFAYEEAIGYMVDTTILDKDGITAAVQLAQCAAYVSTTYNRTLEQQLDSLYKIYGYHFNVNSYYICRDQAVIKRIFQDLQSNYPTSFEAHISTEDSADNALIKYNVARIRDLNNGYDNGQPDNKATLPCSKSSFMITFFIDEDITLTIRTSGTEPKIKYYSEIVAKPDSSKAISDEDEWAELKLTAQLRLQLLVETAIDACLKPDRYKLEKAPDS